MTRYIIEMDRTANSSILPENKSPYIYSIKIFDSERNANAYVRDVWSRNASKDIYLISVYEATTRKRIEHDGVAQRVGVYRSADCENSVADENKNILSFYTMETDNGLALGIGLSTVRWNLETNRQIN